MLIIDPQIDFHPGGSLAIGSANEDAARITALVNNHREQIDDVVVSLDTHQKLHIAHSLFWINAAAEHPAPFTEITLEDVESGTWKVTDSFFQAWGKTYVTTLNENKRFKLLIWPEVRSFKCSSFGMKSSVSDFVDYFF
jgi:nicotinamidase-related amidase